MKTYHRITGLIAGVLLSISAPIYAQIQRVEPPYWWIGMEESRVEILFYGPNIGRYEVQVEDSSLLLSIVNVTRLVNPNYLLVMVEVSNNLEPGTYDFVFSKNESQFIVPYAFESKSKQAQGAAGLDPTDFIYLAFPDRFANGDSTNDVVPDMLQTTIDRSAMFERHGGDLEGIRQRIPYFNELGVTALWINPLVENNQPKESYHGYAATDLYSIDPRFGTNVSYAKFVQECHANGLKVIVDIVYNHWGDQHWIYRDLPDSSWFNFHPEYTRTSYRATTLFDPYAHPAERQKFTDGWFDHHMPDLNQQNPHLANYLIQHSLWTIGNFGVDAFRIDTYAYPDQLFMRDLAQRIKKEYPNFFCFGETWVHGTPVQAWFTEKNGTLKHFDSHLQAVTDFQLYYAVQDALSQPFGWTQGAARLYYTLAKDILYQHPELNVTFLDNHDLSRIFSVLGEDRRKLKIALGFLMTTRGIPSIYYGTEIGMKNFADPDGKVREDFPGGWRNDAMNKFEADGRTTDEALIFDYVKALGQYRKLRPDICRGELVHFVPEDGVYVYFRTGENRKLMVIINPEDKPKKLNLSRFSDMVTPGDYGVEIIYDQITTLTPILDLEPYTIKMYEVR